MFIYIYIYIYKEKETERQRGREKDELTKEDRYERIKIKRCETSKNRIGLVCRVFTNGLRDRDSIPGRVISKIQKWYVIQAIEKGAFMSPWVTVTNVTFSLYIYIYIYIYMCVCVCVCVCVNRLIDTFDRTAIDRC